MLPSWTPSENFPLLHVVDLSTTHCMQMPTLIDALASRPEGPPYIKAHRSPALIGSGLVHLPSAAAGLLLMKMSRRSPLLLRSITKYRDGVRVIPSTPADGFETLMEQLKLQKVVGPPPDISEALVVNCHMMPHYIPDDEACSPSGLSPRSMFFKNLRELEPMLLTLVDEDVDLTANDVVTRLGAAFNYLWIPYDAVDTFLPRGSERRRWYESEIGWKIENVIGYEGLGR
ncbi:uncharacterized protein A4U43_C08F12560 [Asparagus officinalis]|nr:uncharacterized protein A4U43_C08F12560 [Asparagus officinalis]